MASKTQIQSLAKKSKKTEKEVTEIWKEAEATITSQIKYKSPKYWAMVNAEVCKKLKICEKLSFKSFLSLLQE